MTRPATRTCLLAALLALVATGCVTRSTLVPVSTAFPNAPTRGTFQARARSTVNTGSTSPDAPDATGTLWVPRVQLDGSVGWRFGRWFSLRFAGGSGLDAGMYSVGPRASHRVVESAWFSGVAPTLQLPFDHGRTVWSIGPEIGFVVLPTVVEDPNGGPCVERDSADSCVDRGSTYEDDTDVHLLVGGTISVSRWIDRVRLTGLFGVRSQPTLEKAFADVGGGTDEGYVTFVLGAAAQVQIIDELAVELETQWVAPLGPFVFYPTVGLSLVGTFEQTEWLEDPMHPERLHTTPRSIRQTL